VTWLQPIARDSRALRHAARLRIYNRTYYHAKRKPLVRVLTPEQKARKARQRMERYYRNIEQERAYARAQYRKHRARYAEASRIRMRRRAA